MSYERMNNTYEQVQASVKAWREAENGTKNQKRLAEGNPEPYVVWLVEFVRQYRRDLRRELRKFGVKVRYYGWTSEQYVASREHFPGRPPRGRKNRKRYAALRSLSDLLVLHDLLWNEMALAWREATLRNEDPYAPMLRAYFEWRRRGPITATPTKQEEPDASIRQGWTIHLAGWVGAHMSLDRNPRVVAALREDPGGRQGGIRAKLADELVGSTLIAWTEREAGEPLRPGGRVTNLVSRVGRQIAHLGSEAGRLLRRGKLAANESESLLVDDEDDIADFVLRETARQNSNLLEELITKEGFLAPRQRRVMELFLQDYTTKAIADEMNIDTDTIRQHKFRSLNKVREAFEKAGLLESS